MDQPRNFKIEDVELNWARLDKPVSPFGVAQYELQIATTDAAKAKELEANHLKVKEKDGKFTVSLKRKAIKADGSDNGKVRVVDGSLNALSDDDIRSLGNGSVGNVIVFQYPWDQMGRTGIASSLTAIQVTKFEKFVPTGGGVDFAPVGAEPTAETTEDPVEMF